MFYRDSKEFIIKEANSNEFLNSEIRDGPVIRDNCPAEHGDVFIEPGHCIRFRPYVNAPILMKGEL
jgi:hypothetical protein